MHTGPIKTLSILAGVMALTAAGRGHATTLTIYDTLSYYSPAHTLIDSITATPASEAAATAVKGFPLQVLPDAIAEAGVDGPLFSVMDHGVHTNTVGVKGDRDGGAPGYLAFLTLAGSVDYPGFPTRGGDGAPIDVSDLLTPDLRSAGYTAIFSASGAYTAGVPEPATWTMLLLGVAGLGAALRRRRAMTPATAHA